MAGVGLKGALSPMCGGAVVSDQYVLTAAHCCDGKQAAELQVDLGDHDWSHGAEADNFRVGVAAVKMFPGYQHGNNLNNDVCLLRLARALSFPAVPGVRPVCLPPDTADTYADRAAVVAGWGKTGSGNGISNVLLETELVVWPQVSSLLRESISTSKHLYSHRPCAGRLQGGLLERDDHQRHDVRGQARQPHRLHLQRRQRQQRHREERGELRHGGGGVLGHRGLPGGGALRHGAGHLLPLLDPDRDLRLRAVPQVLHRPAHHHPLPLRHNRGRSCGRSVGGKSRNVVIVV